jgi:S1-C subfamily serine protease
MPKKLRGLDLGDMQRRYWSSGKALANAGTADMTPGNSGGPLGDVAGSRVGINSMIVNGLALAVPAE